MATPKIPVRTDMDVKYSSNETPQDEISPTMTYINFVPQKKKRKTFPEPRGK